LVFYISDLRNYQRWWSTLLHRHELQQVLCFSRSRWSFWYAFILAFSPWRSFSALVKKARGRFAASWINLPHTLNLMNSETCTTSWFSWNKESFVSTLLLTCHWHHQSCFCIVDACYVSTHILCNDTRRYIHRKIRE